MNSDADHISDFAPAILEALDFGVVIVDADTHRIAYANSKIYSMGGYSDGCVIGETCHNVLCPAEIGQCPITDKGQKTERTNIQNKLAETNESLRTAIVKREEIQDKIEHLAYHDHLTGLANRVLFTDQLNHAITLSYRIKKMLAIMFLDLDGFKMINDTMGHAVGDRLLKEVALRLLRTVRRSDIVAGIGGDEFVIMIENNDQR